MSQNKLLFKLRAFGFDDAFIELLTSYLSDRTQRVRINTSLSSCTAVPSGVPQGSILGPLLFLLFIIDLPDCVMSSSCYLFADDLKLFSKSSPELFQTDINSVANWLKDNGSTFHPSKAVLLTNVTNSLFFLNDTAINIYPIRLKIWMSIYVQTLIETTISTSNWAKACRVFIISN